jgi:serine protease AprX
VGAVGHTGGGRRAFVVGVTTAALLAAAALPAVAASGSGPGRAPLPALADRDGNHVSDDFQPALDAARAGDRLDVVVTFTRPWDAAAAQRAVGRFSVRREFGIVRGLSATMTAAQARALAKRSEVFRVESDFVVRATLDSANRDFGTEAARADYGVSGSGIGVCVVDTGVDALHEELDNGKVVAWKDFVANKPDPYDDNGHGTHVSSIVAGDGIGSLGAAVFKGVAPAVSIHGAKVLNGAGSGTDTNVIAGVDWCANSSARVISMSLGTSSASDGQDSLSQAVNNAVTSKGKVVVVAAGNSGDDRQTVGSPGAAAQAITVGAVAEWSAPLGKDRHSDGMYLAYFSSRGPTLDNRVKPDVVAPGVTISAAAAGTGNGYVTYSGTSMATPFVAGMVALGIEAAPGLTPAGVRAALEGTAKDWGPAGKDNDWGSGAVDGHAFVANVKGLAAALSQFPTHERLSASVPNNGLWTHTFSVPAEGLGVPIAATVVLEGNAVCGFACFSLEWDPDIDADLRDPNGVVIASSICVAGDECGVGRQETVHAMPTVAGTYTLEVFPYDGSPNNGKGGSFAVDLSGGPLVGGAPPPPPGQPPVASAGSDQTVTDADGNGSQAVTLDGSGSSDPDGTISSYAWSEGAAQIATGLNPTVSLGVGTHTITLTVTDDVGATGTDTVLVTVNRGLVHLGSLAASSVTVKGGWKAQATVTVHRADHSAVSGVTVSFTWSGAGSGSGSCLTNASGVCTVTTGKIPNSKGSQVTFTVTGMTHTWLVYSPASNDTGTQAVATKP